MRSFHTRERAARRRPNKYLFSSRSPSHSAVVVAQLVFCSNAVRFRSPSRSLPSVFTVVRRHSSAGPAASRFPSVRAVSIRVGFYVVIPFTIVINTVRTSDAAQKPTTPTGTYVAGGGGRAKLFDSSKCFSHRTAEDRSVPTCPVPRIPVISRVPRTPRPLILGLSSPPLNPPAHHCPR